MKVRYKTTEDFLTIFEATIVINRKLTHEEANFHSLFTNHLRSYVIYSDQFVRSIPQITREIFLIPLPGQKKFNSNKTSTRKASTGQDTRPET
ncbi:MAG: hypothetical protein ABIN80_20545, partial [Dyadobacter sp.]|uniref:hypothetical protein n=1 Tax=Dyadobacter sp. TaxID=1914288 RepID=UPI0032645B23